MFEGLPIVSLWRLSTPGACPNLTPLGGMSDNLRRGPLAIATYTKYQSCGPCGFRDFFSFSHCKSKGN